MTDLIPLSYDSENPTVSGRELHTALETSTPYKIWFPRMCEYGFNEDRDYRLVEQICTTNNPKNPTTSRNDHALTIPMAKELCMLQRTEKGKQFRQYFLEVEAAWNTPEKIMERAMQIAHQRAVEAERRIRAVSEEKETLEIALNQSLNYCTVAKYNNIHHMGWSLQKCQEIGKSLSAYCRANAIDVKKCETNDERFGTVNSYPMCAWDRFMESDVYEG
jgi:phage anti-repressor protein